MMLLPKDKIKYCCWGSLVSKQTQFRQTTENFPHYIMSGKWVEFKTRLRIQWGKYAQCGGELTGIS